MQAFNDFALVFRILGREPEDVRRARLLQRSIMIPERAGLRRATASPWDRIPIVHDGDLAGASRARIGIYDGRAAQSGKIDDAAARRRQADTRHARAF